MFLYEWEKLRHSRKIGFLLVISLGLLIFVTGVRVAGILQYNQDILRAGMAYDLVDNGLFLWIGYYSLFPLPPGMSFAADATNYLSAVLPAMIMPVMLSLCRVDTYLEDSQADMVQIALEKTGRKKYYFGQALFAVGTTMLWILAWLLIQLILSIPATQFLAGQIETIPTFVIDINTLCSVTVKHCFFYSGLAVLTYSVSLYLQRLKIIVLVFPVVVYMIAAMICIKVWRNDLVGLIFADSGLLYPNVNVLIGFVVSCYLSAVILLVIKVFWGEGTTYEGDREIISG